jgi:hypothetical protein
MFFTLKSELMRNRICLLLPPNAVAAPKGSSPTELIGDLLLNCVTVLQGARYGFFRLRPASQFSPRAQREGKWTSSRTLLSLMV